MKTNGLLAIGSAAGVFEGWHVGYGAYGLGAVTTVVICVLLGAGRVVGIKLACGYQMDHAFRRLNSVSIRKSYSYFILAPPSNLQTPF